MILYSWKWRQLSFNNSITYDNYNTKNNSDKDINFRIGVYFDDVFVPLQVFLWTFLQFDNIHKYVFFIHFFNISANNLDNTYNVWLYINNIKCFSRVVITHSACGNTNFKSSSTAKPETKRGTKKHEQQTQRCDICLEAIEEAIGNNSGQDVILCEGNYILSLATCIGLSRSLFVGSTVEWSEPFFCSYCSLANQEMKIINMSVAIDSLSKVLNELKK